MFIYLLIAGLAGGFIAGLTGIGTGFLMIVIIPIALHHMGIPEAEIVKFTIANTIFATMCAAFVNSITLWRDKHNRFVKETLWVAGAAMISAGIFLRFVIFKTHYSKELYNSIIIIFLLYVIFRTINKLRKSYHYKEKVSKLRLATTGLTGGLVSALTGLGGGSIIIPMLNLWMKMDIKKAKSISFGAIFSISMILTLINLGHQPPLTIAWLHYGYILLPVALPLSIGVILASPPGVIFSRRLSSRTITLIFISLISLVIITKVIELV